MKLIDDLWFKRRDLISDGFDESLEYISKIIPMKIHQFRTGMKCWTWKIPKKWTVNEGWIKDSNGKLLLHSKDHPLHIPTYSQSVDKTIPHDELMKHLMYNEKQPNTIPYHERLIYSKDWGFSLQYSKLENFKSKEYHIHIDAKFEDGFLKVGEIIIPGKVDESVVVVAHLDHPCMVNDDLSGVAGLVELAKKLINKKNYYTYRLFLLPETIGSISFLSQNEEFIDKVKCGIFFEVLGNNADLILQHSKQKDTEIDTISSLIFKKNLATYKKLPFIGMMANDEQVWNGPGVNIPMISIGRGLYPEYHTSDDTPRIVNDSNIMNAVEIVFKILERLDNEHVSKQVTNQPRDEKASRLKQKNHDQNIDDYIPKRLFKGPVFLSGYGLYPNKKRNLYDNLSDDACKVRLLFNYFEGDNSISEISRILDWDFDKTLSWTNRFLEKGLIEKIEIK